METALSRSFKITVADNAAIENILSRRSVRRFDISQPVSQEELAAILECACAAPCAGNYRCRHFVAVSDRAILDSLTSVMVYGKALASAVLAIAVCGETTDKSRDLSSWKEDCAAAMENILLAANALGLGSVWLGVRGPSSEAESFIKEILNIPADAAVLGIAAIGHPLESHDPHKDIDCASLHINKW